jgi:hypothetical protein
MRIRGALEYASRILIQEWIVLGVQDGWLPAQMDDLSVWCIAKQRDRELQFFPS